MNFKMMKHNKTGDNHKILMKVNQELEPFNSILHEVYMFNTSNLTDNEIYTSVYKKAKEEALKVFKNKNLLEALNQPYIEELDNPEGFVIVNPRATEIKIIGSTVVNKEIGKDISLIYQGKVIDQYGDIFSECPVSLISEVHNAGVSLTEGNLTISNDEMYQITLVANYENLSNELVVDINKFEKQLTPDEIRDNYILDLDYRLTKAEMGV